MMQIKKMMLRLFLMAEIVVLSYVYVFGKSGLYALEKSRDEIKKVEQEIVQVKNEIAQLESRVSEWETDDFYKEKFAREQLQMACRDEEIFYIG